MAYSTVCIFALCSLHRMALQSSIESFRLGLEILWDYPIHPLMELMGGNNEDVCAILC